MGNRTFINVKLEEDTEQLEEVVVVAYGTQRKKDLTGAITQIDSKIIGVQSTSSATKALEGSVPGIQVSAVDGSLVWMQVFVCVVWDQRKRVHLMR